MDKKEEERQYYYSKRNDLIIGICSLLDGCSVSIAKGILEEANERIQSYAIDFDKPDYKEGAFIIYDKK